MTAQQRPVRKLAANRRALRDYLVLDRLEAGIELLGTEVKSVRDGHVNLGGAFARVEEGHVVLYHLNIASYKFGNRFNHEPERPRRLLLHKKEIMKLRAQTQEKGFALIPLTVYIRRGLVKVEIGLCKGKRAADKREAIRRKTADRETARAVARVMSRK